MSREGGEEEGWEGRERWEMEGRDRLGYLSSGPRVPGYATGEHRVKATCIAAFWAHSDFTDGIGRCIQNM